MYQYPGHLRVQVHMRIVLLEPNKLQASCLLKRSDLLPLQSRYMSACNHVMNE